jgi:DNA-binding response OmpR family regulator
VEHSTLVGHSILVFEGEPRLAGYLGDTLEGAGAYVALASRADEALGIIEAAELSAAVLDYRLGVEGGQAVARRLTALELPFVFWSKTSADMQRGRMHR